MPSLQVASVGRVVGRADGEALGACDGRCDGDADGTTVGSVLGDELGDSDGSALGLALGPDDGDEDGHAVGASVLVQHDRYSPVTAFGQHVPATKPQSRQRGDAAHKSTATEGDPETLGETLGA